MDGRTLSLVGTIVGGQAARAVFRGEKIFLATGRLTTIKLGMNVRSVERF